MRPLVRLGYLASIQSGITVDGKRSESSDDVTLPYLRVANVQDGHLDLGAISEIRVPRSLARSATLKSGDVLMTEGGDLDKLGRGTVWSDEIENCLHQNHVFAVRPDPGKLLPDYLALVTQSSYARAYFESTGTKTTNLASTSSGKIRDFRVPLPALDDQQRIIEFLDAETARIDQLAALQRSVLARLGQRDRAARDSLIDGLADRVGELPLRRYSPKIEQGSSPPCENHPRDPGEWGVLKLSAVKQGRFYPDENKQLPGDIEPMREYEVHDGDLLVTRANTPELVGDAAVATCAGERLLLPDLIYRVGLDQKMSTEFVAQALLSSRVRTLIQATARGSSQSMVKLRGEDIKEWPIPRADSKQQAEVVAAINDQLLASDKLRSTIDRQLALLAERRQALITAAVTGGITV